MPVPEGEIRSTSRRWLKPLALTLTFVAVLFVALAEYLLHNAEPLLRRRLLATLSARFHAPVTLDPLSISLLRGIEVNGNNLRIYAPPGKALPNQPDGSPTPLLAVSHFAFRTSFHALLHEPTHISHVRLEGMVLHIPPGSPHPDSEPAPDLSPSLDLRIAELQCRNVQLYLHAAKAGKVPLNFDISALDLHNLGRGQPMQYDATLTNAKPIGHIRTAGHFGPWANNIPGGNPALTPIDGTYTFTHADLSTIRGLGGTLASTGHFTGALSGLVVDGTADVPDFSLDLSQHPVPLHTTFHALVDGTSGDTYLQPVHARLGSSDFTTTGKVVKAPGGGHDIALTVDIPQGRMQDFLRLAVRTSPPLMNGLLDLHATLHIPPGDARVAEKLSLAGDARLTSLRFNNPKTQTQIDQLSARAQGHPGQLTDSTQTSAVSALSAHINLSHGVAEITEIHYAIPGALVRLNGVYGMDGKLFEFKGTVQTQATASQMVGGWKGLLLSPLDRYLEKNGAGVELPIEISGTGADLHLGLAFHGTDATPRQMLADVRQKVHDQQEIKAAQAEAAAAREDDLAAARAPTLEAAEAAHARAVQRRADALARLNAARHIPTSQSQP